jgi:hypothetical protein
VGFLRHKVCGEECREVRKRECLANHQNLNRGSRKMAVITEKMEKKRVCTGNNGTLDRPLPTQGPVDGGIAG